MHGCKLLPCSQLYLEAALSAMSCLCLPYILLGDKVMHQGFVNAGGGLYTLLDLGAVTVLFRKGAVNKVCWLRGFILPGYTHNH